MMSYETSNHFFVHLPFLFRFVTCFFELYGFQLGFPMFVIEKQELSDQKQELSTQIPPLQNTKTR